MDTTTNAALVTLITDFSDAVMAMIQTVLPLAGTLVITIGVLFFGWRIFRSIARV